MTDTETEVKRGPPSLAGDFEKEILESDITELEGAWVSFESREAKVSGEVIEVYDRPDGVRSILIERESGVVKAIPLWFLDGVFQDWDHDRGVPEEGWADDE